MKVYLVGGAVRDELLSLPIKERDWVVIGSTPKEMLQQGYKQVGKDFPVFLHPTTKEEYALARTERKTGHGYDGFEVYADPRVTLEDDLMRRDLTINAIAKDPQGEIVDYFNGIDDLNNGILRHVSGAFIEDPLRLVRLCRFKARFPTFHIHDSTRSLCHKMVSSGEVNHLTPERVWLEWQKVFCSAEPGVFIETLDSLGAWQILMPAFVQVKEDVKHIQAASKHIKDERLMATLGWYLEEADLKNELKKLRLPKDIAQLCILTRSLAQYRINSGFDVEPEDLLRCFYRWDVFRRKERFQSAMLVVSSALGRHDNMEKVLTIAKSVAKIKLDQGELSQLSGEQIANKLFNLRLEICQRLLNR